jgi:lipopolysaccharide export system permease protein
MFCTASAQIAAIPGDLIWQRGVDVKLLDRYLLREMVVPFLIGQGAIVLLLTGSVLYNNADVLLANQVPLRFIVRMVLYFIPFLVHMTMPVAMAVAASLAVSRLGRDSEITVMRAAGISMARIFLPIFLTGLVVSVGDFFFGEYIVPKSVEKFQGVLDEIPTQLKTLAPVPGQWITSADNSYTINVRNVVRRHGYIELQGVKIVASPQAIATGETEDIVASAEHGRFENGVWTLYQPAIFRFSNKKNDYEKMKPTEDSRFVLNISVDPQAFKSAFQLQLPMWKMAGSSSRTFWQLKEDVKRNAAQNVSDPYAILNYHFKLSVPFSCLVMALCCPPMAMRFAKGGGFMGTLLSICLVFVYWNTMLLMRILGSVGPEGGAPILAPQVAAWTQNVVFIVVGLWVLRRSE